MGWELRGRTCRKAVAAFRVANDADSDGRARSMAAMSGAWLRRKVHQPWDGGPHRLTMYFATLD
jgi:hypothetical protein